MLLTVIARSMSKQECLNIKGENFLAKQIYWGRVINVIWGFAWDGLGARVPPGRTRPVRRVSPPGADWGARVFPLAADWGVSVSPPGAD